MILRIGELTFDGGRRALARGPVPVHLSRKAFQLLELLLSRRPHVVSKDEIGEVLWPNTFVAEAGLPSLVNEIRKALGDSARSPRWIRTSFGFGYAFDGPVNEGRAPAQADGRHVVWLGNREIVLAEGENLVGRKRGASLCIAHTSVSREHAKILVAGKLAEIEDLGSKNGTWRDGEKVTGRSRLVDGDELRLGQVNLTYRAPTEDD